MDPDDRIPLKAGADAAVAEHRSALGQYMARRNTELGLTVVEVCRRVGMSRASWYRIAAGESASPALRLLRGLARVYRVRPVALYALAAHDETRGLAAWPAVGDSPHEPADVIWRCRFASTAFAGGRVEVRFDLLNLSAQPWCDAEVRAVHPGWLVLDPRSGGPSRVDHSPPDAQAARLPSTEPGHWVSARLCLDVPLHPGRYLSCWSLHRARSEAAGVSGTYVRLDVR
jgi:transcriptional regulator with XRE-family HTH domain